MTRKIISVLLALALLGCGMAAAEEKTDIGSLNVNGAFVLRCAVPEGYSLSVLNQNNASIMAMLYSKDTAEPTVEIRIFFNEEWAETETLSDVSEEDLALIEDSFREMNEVTIEYTETGLGTKLLKATETEDATDFIDFYTIYKGYELEFLMRPGTEPLNEEHSRMLIDFITRMEFVAE